MFAAPPSDDLTVPDLSENPTDSISCIAWSPDSKVKTFASTAWDSKIRIFNVDPQATSLTSKNVLTTEHPCLSVCWEHGGSRLFAGSIDGTINSFDLLTNQPIIVGHHEGVKDMYYMTAARTLFSLGFDKKMKFWDLRQKHPVAELNLGQKVFCSDMVFPFLAMGLSNEKVLILNLLNVQKMIGLKSYECLISPLGAGLQVTSIALSPSKTRIMVASSDGRTNVSRIEETSTSYKAINILTFKSHISDQGGANRITYSVHDVGFHPTSEYFLYTAGADGKLVFWDQQAKNKIRQFNFSSVSVTRAKLSPDGSLMAYALGYDYTRGIEGDMSCHSSINVHVMQDNELVYGR